MRNGHLPPSSLPVFKADSVTARGVPGGRWVSRDRGIGIGAPLECEAFKSGVGSNVSRGMFLILSYTANIFDKMIIAGAGAITARLLIEMVGGVEVLWSYWFIAFLPCSIITVLAAWCLMLWLYPPETAALEGGYEYLRAQIVKMGPWSALEKKAALLLAVAIVLWLTDFLHHISPAVIGMGVGVGLFALLPRVGILDIEDMKRLNYLPVSSSPPR